MNPYPDLQRIQREMETPAPFAGPMTAGELGDAVARLVWESFIDDLEDPELPAHLQELDVSVEEGGVPTRVMEELLIFQLWAHTRAVQLAYYERFDPARVREILDTLHRAVFKDLVEGGRPEAQIPVFEQRVSARYAEYYAAADSSDDAVGEAAARHLSGGTAPPPRETAVALRTRAVEVSGPLRDYLEEVELVDG